jgi:uncharacterized repeat protein (TIGR01451 family)
VGSNGRTINNGSDYEAVDCFSVSPAVSADLAIAKIVDDVSPLEDDSIAYTITVTNLGPGPSTVVQVMDQLPNGVTFVSAVPSQGTYDPVAGDWFVGNLANGANASLTINATVDSGTGGSTITNTAFVEFLSQVDSNAGNDLDTADIMPVGTPSLLVMKSVTTLEDPFNGASNPKAIPGATVGYTVLTTNLGTGPADDGSLVITDAIPANLALRVTDYDGSTDGPVAFADGATASGIDPPDFAALDDLTDDIEFSNDNGASFSYEPIPGANGADPAVTHIRINTSGAMLGDSGSGSPAFRVMFKAIVQ